MFTINYLWSHLKLSETKTNTMDGLFVDLCACVCVCLKNVLCVRSTFFWKPSAHDDGVRVPAARCIQNQQSDANIIYSRNNFTFIHFPHSFRCLLCNFVSRVVFFFYHLIQLTIISKSHTGFLQETLPSLFYCHLLISISLYFIYH